MGRAAERRREVAVTVKKGRFAACEPLFERGPQIALAGGRRVAPGRLVLVEHSGRGARVLEDLGRPDRAADVIAALLAERGPGEFPSKVAAEAESAPEQAGREALKRRDLTGLATFTVDPASARDFDDAVSAEREGDGIRIWVHIADVAAHVRPGGDLDAEALRRATSTYVPGTVAPMLPHVLSSDACSLTPGTERLAVTAEMVLAGDGRVASATFYRSRIRSDARLDYDQLDRIFAGDEAPPDEVATPLELARRAAVILGTGRASLDVGGSEPEFHFEDGDVVAAASVPQTEAHALIERLMVVTNEQVAEQLERRRVPTLFRVHEQPDPPRIEVLLEKLAALGIPTPAAREQISPSEAGKIAIEASRLCAREAERRGHGRAAYTSLVLRSLKQAHYSPRNLGHAGLGSPAYAHFTSPIRRYPDLVAHRALLSSVGGGEAAPRADAVARAAVHCSEREREAVVAERDADDICAAFLLQRELYDAGPGAPFDGEVVGVINAGAFVRFGGNLADVYEGFMPARRIGGRERYELDPLETMLVGRGGGDAIRLGDPVRVVVDRVDAPRGRVDLLPATMTGADRRSGGSNGGEKFERKGRGRGGGKGRSQDRPKGGAKGEAKAGAKGGVKGRKSGAKGRAKGGEKGRGTGGAKRKPGRRGGRGGRGGR